MRRERERSLRPTGKKLVAAANTDDAADDAQFKRQTSAPVCDAWEGRNALFSCLELKLELFTLRRARTEKTRRGARNRAAAKTGHRGPSRSSTLFSPAFGREPFDLTRTRDSSLASIVRWASPFFFRFKREDALTPNSSGKAQSETREGKRPKRTQWDADFDVTILKKKQTKKKKTHPDSGQVHEPQGRVRPDESGGARDQDRRGLVVAAGCLGGHDAREAGHFSGRIVLKERQTEKLREEKRKVSRGMVHFCRLPSFQKNEFLIFLPS